MTLNGGLEDDWYYVDSAQDQAIEQTGAGLDTVLFRHPQLCPILAEHDHGEDKPDDDIHRDARGEGPERFTARGSQFAETRGQTDGEEAEYKRP